VSGRALYVYGVAAGAGVPEGNAGVDERYPVTVVAESGLHAIASEVPLEEFGEDRIGERLADPVWLEAKVRAHEQVLETLSGATVVPLRFGAVFLGEEPVRAMLRERSAQLRDALARVEGRREWGVKVLLDSDVLADWTASNDERAGVLAGEAKSASEGRAFFARKQLGRIVRDDAVARAALWAQEVHGRLTELAAAARTNPVQPSEVSGYELQMLSNGAYLVELEAEGAFRDAVREAEGDYADRGLRCALTGPWPPYNFVGEDAS
jgi:hypothetical protein